jgi:acetylornithine deacetylase
MMSDAIELLAELVRIPSLSHEEGPAADLLEAVLRKEPALSVGRLANNVWASLGDGDELLLLNSHLDVVPASSDHPHPPFEPTRVNGRLYGRGSVDAKASGAAMVSALLTLARDGFSPGGGRAVVALTACEEAGAGYNGLQHLRQEVFGSVLPPVSAALVGEPTRLRPCLAQKGLLILAATAHGRSAHAARAHLGDNAMVRAARDILRLEALAFDRDDQLLGRPTITATTIQGGTVRNAVPDRCSFTLDVRSTPVYTHAELTAIVSGALESEIAVVSDRLVPCSTPADAAVALACRAALCEAGHDDAPFGSPTSSDWVFLADVPTVKIGPGASELSHTANEHVVVDEVADAAELYASVIRHYFAP